MNSKSDKLKKYSIETASDNSEAVFVLSTKRPVFRAVVHRFENFSDFIKFDTANPKVQVHKLPIWLEVVEIEPEFNEKYFERSLKQMAHWYFFTQINGRE